MPPRFTLTALDASQTYREHFARYLAARRSIDVERARAIIMAAEAQFARSSDCRRDALQQCILDGRPHEIAIRAASAAKIAQRAAGIVRMIRQNFAVHAKAVQHQFEKSRVPVGARLRRSFPTR